MVFCGFGLVLGRLFRQVIADMDRAIAAIALQHDCTLVTHNTRHFENIKELNIEDWS